MTLKKMSLWLASLFFLSLLSGTPTWAANPTTSSCYYATGGGFHWTYCIYKPVHSTNTDVMYYFHGLQGSDVEWGYLPHYNDVYQEWGTHAPTVVTLSYGSIWLLAQRNTSAYSGLYENFVNTAMPYIEKNLDLPPTRRVLVGLSMGGFNAAQVYLKNPTLFSRVALLCPALTDVGPYDGTAAISAYIARTHASARSVNLALYVSSTYFPYEAAWKQSDSIALASSDVNSSYPPVFVSGGLQDQYGFEEGAAAFASAVSARGAQATWDPVPGPHCSFDWQAAASFVVAH